MAKTMILNESLRVLRQYFGLSQTQMAEKLGISQPYLSQIEAGKKEVTLEILAQYSEQFQVPMSSLLFFAENLEGAAAPAPARIFIAERVLSVLKRILPDDVEAKETAN